MQRYLTGPTFLGSGTWLSPVANSSTGLGLVGGCGGADVGRSGRIEYVFEGCTYPELLDAMGDAQQAERAAFARQLMAVGSFAVRRMDEVYAEHEFWCVDDWEAIAAEVRRGVGHQPGPGVIADALRRGPAQAVPETW